MKQRDREIQRDSLERDRGRKNSEGGKGERKRVRQRGRKGADLSEM